MKDREIRLLEAKGAKRWTKGDKDRLYVTAEEIGLTTERYKSGNIRHAEWCGEAISNRKAGYLCATKVWYDLTDDKVHVMAYGPATEYADEIKERAEEFFLTSTHHTMA